MTVKHATLKQEVNMLLHLVAFDPRDGWALVGSSGGLLWLSKPPHTSREAITREQAAALRKHGDWPGAEGSFGSWDELAADLNRRREASASSVDLIGAARRLLQGIPPHRAEAAVAHAERLASDGDSEGAALVARALSGAPAVSGRPDLAARVARLHER